MLEIFTGLRASELMGLRWEDVDLVKQSLSVHINRQYISKEYGIVKDTPKTKKSERALSIPIMCVQLLRELKHLQNKQQILLGSKWGGSNNIFINDFGEPIFPRYLSKWFIAFIEREGLRRITFHQLRHTHASLLDSMDVNETQISRRLGHNQISTTRDTYTHLFKSIDQEASDKMDIYFNKIKETICTSFTPMTQKCKTDH